MTTCVGIESRVLQMHWDPMQLNNLGKGQLQEETRSRRYLLLLEACHQAKLPLLLTAHNRDDDIVTMLYRFGHGSGLEGLGGMKMISPFPIAHYQADCHFVGHPLLGVGKERLIRTCEEHKLPYNTDASNADRHYQRNAIGGAILGMQQELLEKGADLTEELGDALHLFKDIRRDIHDRIVPLFAQSIYINRTIGDATILMGKDTQQTLLSNGPVLNRAMGTVAQYVAARSLPVRTSRMLAVQRSLRNAMAAHQEEVRRRQATRRNQFAGSMAEQDAYLRAQRPEMNQITLGGAIVYPLARADALRRAEIISRLGQCPVVKGPGFLVQREPPSRIDSQMPAFLAEIVKLAPGQVHLWDDRIYLHYDSNEGEGEAPLTDDKGERTFAISFMTMADVRHFEQLTKQSNSLVRRRLYSYLGTTPGTHLYQIPVIRELTEPQGGDEKADIVGRTIYMAFPTLRLQYPLDKHRWTVKHAGNSVLVTKFHCLP